MASADRGKDGGCGGGGDVGSLSGNIMSMASGAYAAATNFDTGAPDFGFDSPVPNPGGGFSAPDMPSLPEHPGSFTYDSLPTESITAPTLPGAPSLVYVSIPSFDGSMPALNFPDTPEWTDYEVPTEPTITTINPPDKPAYVLPVMGTLTDVVLPDPPALDLPVFDANLIDEDLLEPTNTFSFNEPEYVSAVKELLSNGLYDAIYNGNYGLDALDEQRLFDRARERELQGALLASENATRPYNLSGFPMPPGTLLRVQNAISQEVVNKVTSFNRELLIKEADLHWEGKKFSYTQAIEWEKTLMSFHNSLYERLLNAAKAEVQVALEVFRTRLDRYKVQQERYIARADVFKSLIQGELAKMEIYKAQIDAAKAKTEINRMIIEQYNARLEAIKTIMAAYQSEVEAFKTMTEAERIKIEMYKSQVEAYIGKIQGEAARFEAYKAAIQGEVAKVEVYKAQAEAYAAMVAGAKVAVDMNTAIVEQYRVSADVAIQSFNVQAKAIEMTRAQALAAISAAAEAYRANAAMYEAQAGVIVKIADTSGRWAEANYRVQMASSEVAIQSAKVQLEAAKASAEVGIEAMRSRGQIYAALAASAMSAINLNSSVSSSENKSCSESWVNSDSYSETESKSESKSESLNINQNANLSEEMVEYHYYEE